MEKNNNSLKPVALTGIIAPCSITDIDDIKSDYKLICASGLEYYIIAADTEWRSILCRYRWEEVKVIGLLNMADMTIIPQKVYPKGPAGEVENILDLIPAALPQRVSTRAFSAFNY